MNSQPAEPPVAQQDIADELYALAAEGHINMGALQQGLRLIGYIPAQTAWRRFLDYLLLILGALLLVSGIFFFFAYNWEALHRFVRLGLVEVAILAAVAIAHWLGLQKLSGRVALLAAALLVGALLAVFGQEYQTGADSYTLFLNWMLLISGWVLIGAFAPLWLLLLGLANLTLILYWSQIWSGELVWQFELLFSLNAAALLLWEGARSRGIRWLRERWYARLVALAAYIWVTAAVLNVIFDGSSQSLDNPQAVLLAPVLYALFVAASLYIYQYYIRDLFILTCAALSLIGVTTSFIAERADFDDLLLYLLLGALVIIQASVAVTWLLRVQRTWRE